MRTRRRRSCFVLSLLCLAPPLLADQVLRVGTLSEELPGAVGGVAVDALGYIYSADFGQRVWKISPQGEVEVLADTLYGASGNAVDADGSLLQSNFNNDTITRIERDGSTSTFASGLQGPVGIAIGADREAYVCNCRSNEISRISPEGVVETFASGDLFNCPNGITRDPDGNLYVVNFSDGKTLEIQPDGEVSLLATLPGGGNGHITWVGPHLYATAFRANQIYRIDPSSGEIAAVAGTGLFGQVDSDKGAEARFSTPNGIAYSRSRDMLYTNDYLNPWSERFTGRVDPKASIRTIAFPTLQETFNDTYSAEGLEAAKDAVAAFMEKRPGTPYELILNGMGYGYLQAGNTQGALAIFEMNTHLFPNSFNVWDSLAEAMRATGQKAKAIEYYEKSLELNPDNANATAMLKEMAAE